MAQIIVSVQMVLEEKFVYKHDVHPLRAVGTEGKAAVSGCGPFVNHNFTLKGQRWLSGEVELGPEGVRFEFEKKGDVLLEINNVIKGVFKSLKVCYVPHYVQPPRPDF